MSQPTIPSDSKTNHREHETLRLEVESLRAALDSLAAYSEAIANLRSLREVAEHLRSLLSDVPNHMVHEERTILSAMERLGPDEARFAELMCQQHRMLSAGLAKFFQMLNAIHDSNDLRAGLRELQDCGANISKLLLHHMETEDRRISLLAGANETTVSDS
jgi:iron-sulfur cluster repair protein YtfE (RIC family)